MAESDTRRAGTAYLMLATAVLFWGGHWVVARALRDDAPPVAIAFWRWAIAAAVLLPLCWRGVRAERARILSSWRILVLLALFASVTQHIPVYLGLRLTTATNGALLNATTPIFILLLARVLLGERLSATAAAGVAVSIAGVVLVVSRGEAEVLRTLQLNPGDFWVLIATLSWAGYTVALHWRPRGLDPMVMLAVIAAASTALIAPLYVAEHLFVARLEPGMAAVGGILYIALLPTVAGYILWNRGVELVGPSRAGPFMYLMLVFTPLLAVAFLGESIRWYHLAGTVLILAGIAVANRGRRPPVRG